MGPLFSNGRLSTEAGVLSCHLAPSGAPRLVYLRLISLPSGNAVTLFNDMTPRTGDSATCTHTPCPLAQLPGAVSCWEDDITLLARALSWRKIGMSPGWAGGLSGQGPALELSYQSSLASPTGQDPKDGFLSPRSIIHESKMMYIRILWNRVIYYCVSLSTRTGRTFWNDVLLGSPSRCIL